MRNLSVLSSTTYALPNDTDDHIISAITVDLDEDVVFVASESANADDVNILIWKVDQQDTLQRFADFTSPAIEGATLQIVSFIVIADTRTLCIITRSGDIAILPLEDGTGAESDALQSFDTVGTLTPGPVLAVAVAPDSSLFVIITPAASLPAPADSDATSPILHLMSPTSFTLISSSPIATTHRGAAAPINVGWGSKSTQFHGSLGKSAAQAQSTTESECTTTPDDDAAPRVSWRGDAQFFAVSALEGHVSGKRVLRMYNRAGVLQSTAEDVPGLEHALSWRPSGGLIASVQRFGNVPGGNASPSDQNEKVDKKWALGRGTDGRHDVVFFERNGLRHGEFSLRESWRSAGGFRGSGPSAGTMPMLDPSRRWGYKVRELGWNADSSVLSVWLEREADDVVQLWTTGNYHWYLKMELPAPGASRFTSVSWHVEDPSRLLLTTIGSLVCVRYVVSITSSPSSCGTGLVGVVDGDALLLTPFRTQNVPPPMASARLSLSSSSLLHASPALPSTQAQNRTQPSAPPVHITFAPKQEDACDILAALLPTRAIALWTICSPVTVKKGSRDAETTSLLWKGKAGEMKSARQVCVREGWRKGEWIVGVLGDGEQERSRDVIGFIMLIPTTLAHPTSPSTGSTTESQTQPACLMEVARMWEVDMPGRGGRLVEEEGGDLETGTKSVVWQAKDGGLWEVPLCEPKQHSENDDKTSDTMEDVKLVSRLPEICASATRVCVSVSGSGSSPGSPPSSNTIFIGLSVPKLSMASSIPLTNTSSADVSAHPSFPFQSLSQACTSYAISGPYLVWTATAPTHEAFFVRLGLLYDVIQSLDQRRIVDLSEKRRIERGARIVTVVPSTMSLVLQMPRGNLETVMPRPLVMEQVRADVQSGDYRSAFLACRKHRVDLNVLVELDPAAFAKNIDSFVGQLDDVDYINLFLSGLSRSSLSSEMVNRLCDGIRVALEQRDIRKFINSVLTAHVVKNPPDYEAGLSLLLRLRGENSALVEDAVKYIIFLVDADRLFDTALGMYDFSLVLLVAQYSQKDPREYLPFLRSLHALEGAYQHFKIDDHLKRYTKALHSLHRAGQERFEEAKLYVEKHGLYADALEIWKEERAEYDALLELYGDYLFDRREFRPAALAFVQSSRIKKAMIAYEKALCWQELFELVLRDGISGDKLSIIARRIADELESKQRHTEAARVLLDYGGDVDEAIASFVRGNAWSEARRIAALHKRDDLVTLLILPGTLEARSSISDEIEEVRELLEKQVGRLDELAAKKLSEPEAFYGLEDANLANVDVMTDVSNPGTMFTRYTVAPTSSDRSRRTSRSKRKLDRKAGRKGTVEEEEYLLKSLAKLVVRLEAVQAECRALLPHLLILSEEHAREGKDLQREMEDLEQAMRSSVERIWTEREKASMDVNDETSLAAAGAGGFGQIKLVDKVPKPFISDVPWKVGWIKIAR